MITDEQMRAAAAAIADEARDNHGGVDVISVGLPMLHSPHSWGADVSPHVSGLSDLSPYLLIGVYVQPDGSKHVERRVAFGALRKEYNPYDDGEFERRDNLVNRYARLDPFSRCKDQALVQILRQVPELPMCGPFD